MVRRIHFITTWVLIQALLAGQVLPGSVWAADTLRAQASREVSQTATGLEEALTAPTIVSRVSEKRVPVARRSVGTEVGSGGWNPSASPAEELTLSSEETAEIRRTVDRFLNPGAAVLRRKAAEPVVRQVLSATGKALPIVFFSNSSSLLNWRVTDEEQGQIGVDVTVPDELYQSEYAQGLALLSALLMHHAAARAAGKSSREAYHATIDFYLSLSDDERSQLNTVLETPWIDHGNTFRTFLHRASDETESPTIQERDRQVSWLLGQIQIDLPYDRVEFGKAARDPELTLDQRRTAAAKVIADYDRDVEKENARRVAASVRESLPDGYPPALLVAGRLSRAFSNQAYLFADSAYVPKTDEIVEAVTRLDQAIRGEVNVGAGSLQETLNKELLRVRPSVAKLRLLALGPEPAAPMTQYRGAVRQTREAMQIVRDRMEKAIPRLRDQRLSAAREGISRRASADEVAAIKEQSSNFQLAFEELAKEIDAAIVQLEGELAQAKTVPAAFSVLLQRPSATGSINLYEVNELEPKPEQEEDLQKLVRLGGHNTYGSPDLSWVAEATDIIEAAPLSIYERLVEVEGRHITVFEVDQKGIEETARQMADPFAQNIDQTMDSEHAVLARRVVVESDRTLAEKARRYREAGATEEGAILRVIREAGEPVQQQTARVAAWVEREFDRRVEKVEALVESRWKAKEFIDRLEALRRVLPKPAEIIRSVRRARSLEKPAERLLPAVLAPRRERPAFHMLTTQSPGLVEGLFQVVLEEEMALRNVLAGEGRRRGKDYEAEVQKRMKGYSARISALAERVVEQFGYGVMVDNLERQGLSRDKALQRIIGDNVVLQNELARMAVLVEVQEAQQTRRKKYTFNPARPEHPLVEEILNGDRAAVLRLKAEQQTAANNRFHSASTDLLRQERDQRMRSLAREIALAELDRKNPGWQLQARAKSWWRQHTALAQTTARREVVAANKLHARMMDPRYYYGSGAVYQRADGKFTASGRRKRYDLIYAPSRVNLARGERESVEVYPQWVGVTDPLSARRAHRVYSLINENVQVRLIKEAETLKVSENERTALVRAVANTQALFTEGLGFGDPEDLSYQFNLRGGLPVVAMKEGESFQPGPTTGYCIPKDPLFKLFRHALTDAGKLTQIGIPAELQPVVMQMAAEIEARRDDFTSEGEFEQWVMQELLSQEGLRRRFKPADADAVQKALNSYIEVTGGVLLFHLTKLHEILGNLGRPSLLASRGQDLGRFLWSQWAGKKVTLGGEQVNRATVALMTSDVFKLREEAARLNPNARVAAENQMFVHIYGPYKGDPDNPSPPDMRDSAGVRLFMDLSDLGELVVHSLDEEGQTIWRANRYGLRLDSNEPDDLRVTRLLAEEFLEITEVDVRKSDWYLSEWRKLQPRQGTRPPQGGIADPQQFIQAEGDLLLRGFAEILRALRDKKDPRVTALQERFVGHGTVGNITLTVVPGVSRKDAMEAKVDAKQAMNDAADAVQELLVAAGGLSLAQMEANAKGGRPLDKWIPLAELPAEQQAKLVKEIGGKIHPLMLRLRGPGTEFLQDLQKQDVVVLMTVHPELLELDPAHLRDLMLTGRPNSALGVRDGSVQGRHRVWFDREVMLWYAAGRGVDQNGRIIRDWSRRDTEGRQAVYTAFGVGEKSWKPLLGTDLREEVVRQEHRAMALYAALERVANASAPDLEEAIRAAEQVYQQELPRSQMALEASLAAEYQQMVQGKGVDRPRDEYIRAHLQGLAEGLSLQQFTPIHWLSTGGTFLLNGAPEDQQKEVQTVLARAQDRMRAAARATAATSAGLEEPTAAMMVAALLVPQRRSDAMAASEKEGTHFSVKASEQQADQAVAKLTALQAEAVRQGALAQREKGFGSVSTATGQDPLEEARLGLQQMGELLRTGGPADGLHQTAGAVLGWTVQSLLAVNDQILSGDPSKKAEVARQIVLLTDGRELKPNTVRRFTGTYEDPGIFALWFERAGDAGRESVASAVELFTMSLALEKMTPFLNQPADQVEEPKFWRALADFYAETLDDHYHEYNPWAYDPKRGSGFSEFYDDLGILKPERAEELYGLAWRHGRVLYGFLRELAVSKTSLAKIPDQDRDLLLGRVTLAATAADDVVSVRAIGAGAAAPEELKWRAYNQLREMAFLRNDGFQWPVVFEEMDPDAPEILDARQRVNFTFMAAVGRTHYSRALMEGPALGENLFITRNGRMVQVAGSEKPVLQIDDAQFWMSEAQYKQALMRHRNMDDAEAEAQIARDRKAGRLVPKGIRVAARFTSPVTVGSVVAFHHHPLVSALSESGYPYTDKSEVHYDITYDKSLYPFIFNPAYQTGVLLPPEIDWHHEDTVQAGTRGSAVSKIRDWLRPFAQQHGTLIIKGSAESGARNFKRVDLLDSDSRIIEDRLTAAAEFIYEVSKGQNVTVQKMILTTPIAWMDPAAVQEFVERQIKDFGKAVNLGTHPKNWVYGSVRAILSSGVPKNLKPDETGLFNPDNWEVSHRIALASLEAATNVGRGGTLNLLTPESIRPEFRDRFISEMEQAGQRVMVALARYGKKYAEHGGQEPAEFDASGVPYWWPRYMMLDIIPEPVWGRDGREVQDARIVDVISGDPERGTSNRFVLRTPDGQQFDGEILGFKFWLLEPNIGIGLWPNYWKRELVHEQARAKADGNRPVDWNEVGKADRVVLDDYLLAGESFLNARFGSGYFDGGTSHRRPVAAAPETAAPIEVEPTAVSETATDSFQQALSAVRGLGVPSIGTAEASLVLVEAGIRALGGRAALVGQDPQAILDQANRFLDSDQIATQFPQGAGISVSGSDVAQWLRDSGHYRKRVAELIVDRVLSEPLAPPVAVLPDRLTREEAAQFLPESSTFAVVTGKRALMNHHVYPFEVARGGRPVNVVGVDMEWLGLDLRANRLMVLNPGTGNYYVEFGLLEPAPISRAFIVELLSYGEVSTHEELTAALTSDGVQVINPAGDAQQRADDKYWLRQHAVEAGIEVPFSVVVPQNIPSVEAGQALLDTVADRSPSGVVIQPSAGTTEGTGVRWFSSNDKDGQAGHVGQLALAKDSLVSSFRANVTSAGRSLALRVNVSNGRATSASAIVGKPGEKIASLGQEGEVIPLGQALNQLRNAAGEEVRITVDDWERIEAAAEAAAVAVGLPLTGIDIVLDQVQGQLRPVVIEANARPGLLIFGETVRFPQSDEQEIESHAAAPVGPDFWDWAGMTLQQWTDLLKSGETNWLAGHYNGDLGAHRARLADWTDRLLESEVPGLSGVPLFDRRRLAVVTRTPGRSPVPVAARHLDYVGGQGGSLGSPTEEETVIFAQVVDGLNGNVEVYQVVASDPAVFAAYPDEGKGPRVFSLQDEVVNPDVQINTLADWDAWAAKVTEIRKERRAPEKKLNHADDLAAASASFARTDFGDPSGRIRNYLDRLAREGKGLRFGIAANLPVGGGLSSSSSVAIGFAQALAALAGVPLSGDALVNFGYAERFYAGTQGGIRDQAHIVNPPGLLGVEPIRAIATIEPVPGTSVLMLDSGISRDNAAAHSPKLSSPGNDEQNIKGRTATGYALANLWFRHIHPDLTAWIKPDAKNPDGYLRNLVPGNPGGMSVEEVYRLLSEVPAEGLTRRQMVEQMPEFKEDLDRLFAKRPEPPEPYALREMALFFFAEESRNGEVVRTLQALKAKQMTLDQAFQRLIEIGRAAHNGDRVTRYEITPGESASLNVKDIGWNWRVSNDMLDRFIADSDADAAALWRQAGRLERSIEPLDRLVDLVQYFNQLKGGNAAVAVVTGAGLGGTVGALVRDEFVEELKTFLDQHYYKPLGLSHGPAIRARVGKGASDLAAPLAGLEEEATLEQWQKILADPAASGFKTQIEERYGTDAAVYEDRLQAYRQLVAGAIAAGFSPQEPVVIVASTGRFRFFEGHTDFLGLGGRTLDGATEQEILFVLQKTGDRRLYLSSADPARYPAADFPLTGPDPGYPESAQNPALSELQYVARHFEEWGGLRARARWSVDRWDQYVRGGLAFLMHQSSEMEKQLEDSGVRIHVSNLGALALPAGMGVSSSAALNVGIGTGMNALFQLGLSQDQLAEVDLGERLLGKGKGAGDSAAIVFAQPKRVVAVGSYPVRFLGVAQFPEGLEVLQAVSPIPRLTTSEGEAQLRRDYSSERVSRIVSWARETMERYSSAAYQGAVAELLKGLRDPSRYEPAGISSEQAAVVRALTRHDPNGLLRELTLDGALGEELPEFAGWENRHRRYELIYRLLLLIPESGQVGRRFPVGFRKAALYGLAEEERGIVFLQELEGAVAAQQSGDVAQARLHIQRILDLVEWAHDGDRATEDYRRSPLSEGMNDSGRMAVFPPTPWASDSRNDVSDAAVRRWIAGFSDSGPADPAVWHPQELFGKPGGYERSIPDFDEIADAAKRRFNGLVRMRVSAAGLGGGMVVYIDSTENPRIREEFSAWLSEQGWQAKPVHLGTPVQVIQPPASGLEEPLGLPSPVVRHERVDSGIDGYRRLVYQLTDGTSWLGGVVKSDVPEWAIAPTAYVSPYSYVEGPHSVLEANAKMTDGTAVMDSAVGSHAQLKGSVVEQTRLHPAVSVANSALTPAFDQDSWSYSEVTAGNPALSVSNHTVEVNGNTYRVELGPRTSAEGAVIQDSFVGEDSRVSGSALFASRWGPQTQLKGGVKSWLAVADQGHAEVAGVQHRSDGTEVPAALEVAETAYVGLPENQYSGPQIREERVGYTEVAVGNSIPLAHYDGVTLSFEERPVPPLTLVGDYGIFSIFAGSPNPASIKTNGRPTPGVVTRLTGGPGEQTSQHGRIVVDPLSIVGSFSNVIGRLLGFPEWGDTQALLNEPEITHLGALSTVGVDAQLGLNGLEAWGQVLPAEARGQLGRASGMAPWVFLYAPEVLFSLMGQLGPQYDDLPKKILESGLALSRWMLARELTRGGEANRQIIERLERYAVGYASLIESGAWSGPWVKTGPLRHPESWRFNEQTSRWETDSFDLEAMHRRIHPLAASVPYAQISLNQMLALPEGVVRPDWSEWTPYYLKPEDLETDAPTPPDQLRAVPDALKFWRIIGQDGRFYYTVEGGRIDVGISLIQIHQSAVIGPGTVLQGSRTTVGKGSRLLRVVADNLVTGKNVQLAAVRAQDTVMEDNVRLTWAKLGPNVFIGSGTTGAYVAVADHSVIGRNNTFEPFALVVRSTTATGNVIGVSLVDSRVLPGFMGRHLSTAVHGLDQQPVRFSIAGQLHNVHAASLNVAGGMFLRGSEDFRINLSAAYPLSLTTIEPGRGVASEIGAFSVLKNRVVLDGEILPLTFHAFNNRSSSDPRFTIPGRHNDAIGGALDFPGIFLRNFIFRTKKGVWDDHLARGFQPAEILTQPDLLRADYMVEATMVETLRQVRNQLNQIDFQAAQYLWSELGDLVEFVEQDLRQIRRADQTTLGRRSATDRQRIAQLIAAVRQKLDSLPGQRPSETQVSLRSGHSAGQLIDGIRRLAENLDGRWRMRDHTFTEVEWRYVARDGEKALDTWRPVPRPDSEAAGLEEPVQIQSTGTVVIFTPGTVEQGIPLLEALQPPEGQKIRVAAAVSGDAQEKRVLELLTRYPQLELHALVNMEKAEMSQIQAVDSLKADAWGELMETYVVDLLEKLRDLGIYLKMPDISNRAWNRWLDDQGVSSNL